MRIEAVFCINHGDEVKSLGSVSRVADSELACPRIDDRLDYTYSRMSRELAKTIRAERFIGRIGDTAHLVTHPNDLRGLEDD